MNFAVFSPAETRLELEDQLRESINLSLEQLREAGQGVGRAIFPPKSRSQSERSAAGICFTAVIFCDLHGAAARRPQNRGSVIELLKNM